jgi:hypothetical protein
VPNNRTWVYLVALAFALAIAYVLVDSTFSRQLPVALENSSLASPASVAGSLSIVTLTDGRLGSGAVYRISPDPFTGSGNFTIHDGDVGRDQDPVEGIITIEGMSDGTFSVIQIAGADGQENEIIPRIVTIANSSSESALFGLNSSRDSDNTGGNDPENIESVLYASKFECGTIRGAEGPLRPGHYDTDIGIFNKQGFPVRITWSAASTDNEPTNALLKTLGSQTSTSIVCNDIRKLLDVGPEFVEGFVLVEVPVDPRLRASISGSSSVLLSPLDSIDVLDVQTFYTANALDELPHPILVDKISFVIRANETSVGLPSSLIGKILDITLPSEVGALSDPEERVKSELMQRYNLTEQQVSRVAIEIKSINVGVGTMIDDHAVSLSKVRPQLKFN